MEHWIADCLVGHGGRTYSTAIGESIYLIYHWLRTAGWEGIWMCDDNSGVINHIDDANMEESGTVHWTKGGSPVVTKSTTEKHMGTRSLGFQPLAQNDYVVSDGLVGHELSSPYFYGFWAKATVTGEDVDVEISDGVSFANVGTIVGEDGSDWKHYTFKRASSSSGSPAIRFIRSDAGGITTPIYIDSMYCCVNYWEDPDQEDLSGSPGGQILNGNEFASTTYDFVVGDVGKYICVWDTANAGNSGVYEITGNNGDNAVLDLRASGSPALTAQTGLRWRMVDPDGSLLDLTAYNSYSACKSGFGLQSSHSTGWRLFCRFFHNGSSGAHANFWSSPRQIEFDTETGEFLLGTAPSTQDVLPAIRDYPDTNDAYTFVGDGNAPAQSNRRLYCKTDDDGSYLIMCARHTAADVEAFGVVGFTGTDPRHTEEQSFVHLMSQKMSDGPECKFTNVDDAFSRNGCQMGSRDIMTPALCPHWGFYDGAVVDVNDIVANSRDNPFDSSLWLEKLPVIRDFFGDRQDTSEKAMDIGIYRGRNRTAGEVYTSVDSHNKLYIRNGIYINWMGRESLP